MLTVPLHYTRHRARRSNVLPYYFETATPLASPVDQFLGTPRLQEILPLDPPREALSPLDELIFWLNDAAAMCSAVYPQITVNSKHSPAGRGCEVQAAMRCGAVHDGDDVPAIPEMGFRCHQCTFNKSEFFEGNAALKGSRRSHDEATLQHPAECDTTVLDYCDQVPARLKISLPSSALRRKKRM